MNIIIIITPFYSSVEHRARVKVRHLVLFLAKTFTSVPLFISVFNSFRTLRCHVDLDQPFSIFLPWRNPWNNFQVSGNPCIKIIISTAHGTLAWSVSCRYNNPKKTVNALLSREWYFSVDLFILAKFAEPLATSRGTPVEKPWSRASSFPCSLWIPFQRCSCDIARRFSKCTSWWTSQYAPNITDDVHSHSMKRWAFTKQFNSVAVSCKLVLPKVFKLSWWQGEIRALNVNTATFTLLLMFTPRNWIYI
jgi:hypothetical protein